MSSGEPWKEEWTKFTPEAIEENGRKSGLNSLPKPLRK